MMDSLEAANGYEDALFERPLTNRDKESGDYMAGHADGTRRRERGPGTRIPDRLTRFPVPKFGDPLRDWFWRLISENADSVRGAISHNALGASRMYMGRAAMALAHEYPDAEVTPSGLMSVAFNVILDGGLVDDRFDYWRVSRAVRLRSFKVKVESPKRGEYGLRSSHKLLRLIIDHLDEIGVLPDSELKRFVVSG